MAVISLSPTAWAKAPALDERCEKKKDVNVCMDLAFGHMAKKKKSDKKLALKYFKLGCEAQKKHACSNAEAKALAKDFRNQGRSTASQKK
jgi:hypothetical protein